MSRMLIGFSGPAGCGKTTAARIMWRHSAKGATASFADPLKECLQELFDFSDDQLRTLEGKEAIDPRYGVSPRTLMQQFGTEFVRKVVPGLWCILMEKTIKEYSSLDLFIDDVRFNDEANLIRRLGGQIVHIEGRSAGIQSSSHKSEKGIFRLDKDIVIDNSGTLSDLRTAIKSQLL